MTELESKLHRQRSSPARARFRAATSSSWRLPPALTVTAANAMFVEAVRAEPKKGGTLKIGLAHGATTDSLDPGLYHDQFTGTACWGTLSNSLTEIDAKGNAVPDLAESFEPADGAKKWVFKIRKGVTFHNGKTVTADDVVASIKHHSVEGTKSAAKSLLAAVKDVKADGPETVIFELDGGNADFPYIVSDYHIPIMPRKDDGAADWQSGIRTGPYTLDKFEPGVTANFNKNPNYFKSRQAPGSTASSASRSTMSRRAPMRSTSGETHYIIAPI